MNCDEYSICLVREEDMDWNYTVARKEITLAESLVLPFLLSVIWKT
jgi:hypothetical protein